MWVTFFHIIGVAILIKIIANIRETTEYNLSSERDKYVDISSLG